MSIVSLAIGEKNCGDCLHWHEEVQVQPAKPQSGVLDMSHLDISQPRPGQCRCMPPQLMPVGGGRATAFFPILDNTSPACGQHASRSAQNGKAP